MSDTLGFEPNGTEVNTVECDGTANLAFVIRPTFFDATVFYGHLVLIGGVPAGGVGPIIFHVPPDPLDTAFVVPADPGSFYVPYETGAPRC